MVNLEDAKEVTATIIKSVHPLMVILFGSVANKGAGEDIDLLIVIKDRRPNQVEEVNLLLQKNLKEFYKRFPIDPFVISVSALNEYYLKGSPFLWSILKGGRFLYMEDITKEWLNQAEEELNMAQYLLNGGYFKGACYHSQQSIEKAIKAILLKKGWELEKTHNIKRLIVISEDFKVKFDIADEDIVFIDSIYRGRYPIDVGLLPLGEPRETDAKRSVEIAKKVVDKANLVAGIKR